MSAPESTIFISYSQKDRAYLDELLTIVKPTLERVHGLAAWSDTDLASGQLWNDEIKDALRRARVVVLLLSNNFLGSTYIKDKELPVLLPRYQSGELRVYMVFVSAVPKPALTVSMPTPGDDFDLLSITAENRPEQPLSEMDKPTRDRLFVNLAEKLYQLAAPVSARATARSAGRAATGHGIQLPRGFDGRRPQLLIRLQRSGVELIREYLLPNHQRPYSPELPGEDAIGRLELWQPGQPFDGDLLFELLFGNDETLYQELLTVPSSNPGPTSAGLHPWRLRLLIDPDDERLQSLPWTHISHQGVALTESGWSVEFTPAPPRLGPLDLPNHPFIMPGRVLLVFPDAEGDEIAAAHLNDLHARLQQMWNKQPPVFVANRLDQVSAYLSDQSPRLVYWYGRVAEQQSDWRLVIDRGDGEQGLSFAELHRAFSTAPPSALFFNLIGEDAVRGFAATAELVEPPAAKFLGYQVSPMGAAVEAGRAGIRWLDGVLRDDQRLDPVAALHHNGHAYAACRTSYQAWDPQLGDAHLDDDVAHLLLDRTRQRRHLLQARDDLIDLSNKLRVHCLLVAGTPGNRIEDFPDQGRTHLSIHPRDGIHSWLCPIQLPAMTFDTQQLETAYRRHFGLAPSVALFDALTPPQRGHGTRILVPILAWTLAIDSSREQREANLLAILEWSREALALDCPKDQRVISLITLQIDDEDELEDLRDSAEDLDERLTDGQDYRRSSSFRFEAMDRLQGVSRRDLKNYFDSEYCTCPDGLRRAYPELLMQGKKERAFAEVVGLIQQASQSWHATAKALKLKIASP